ncbi:hypothetical protein Tco_1412447, partial [Tanacetum coccineum]
HPNVTIPLRCPDFWGCYKYPEYVAPSDDEIPVEDQPLPTDASPTALSPGYVVDTDLEEDPEEDPEEDLKEPSKDDDEEEESSEDEDDDEEEAFEEEEEHLAPTDSAILPAIDPVPLAEETKPFETDESAATPPPPPTRSPRLSYHHHPTAHRDDIPEADMPLWKRARFTDPTHRFGVGESSATVAARQIANALTSSVDHGFIDTVDASI